MMIYSGKRVKGWVHDPNNITTGGWGLTLTVREMARFGQLYLNNGFWNGKQIIPQDWIAKSTAPNLNHYGYMWWLFENHGLDAFAAMGDGGNTICCVPQKKLVVAIASHFIPNPKDMILSILVDTFISKISLPMQPVPEIGSISVA